MPEAENYALPGGTNDSWRAWLTTGVRRSPADRRRLRGEYRGLKRMLLEGMTNGGDRPHAWKDFSGVMIRHAVDDAMRSLPVQDKQVVKLAYFGGFSNREIAEQVGLTEATVQRRLRRGLSAISAHIQHGRAMGRRVALAVGVWLSARWLVDSAHHIAQTAAVASVTVIVAAQPFAAPPATHPVPARHAVEHVATAPAGAGSTVTAAPAAAGSMVTAAPAGVIPPVPSPTPVVPVTAQLPVAPPVLPPLPVPPLPALPPPPVTVKIPHL